MANSAPNLQSMPTEIHTKICGYLNQVDSSCFGVARKSFYSVHSKLHGLVSLASPPVPFRSGTLYTSQSATNCQKCSLDAQNLIRPEELSRHGYCVLYAHLRDWMPRDLFYCLGCDMYTARYRGKGEEYPFQVLCWVCHESDEFFVVPAEYVKSFEERKVVVRGEEATSGRDCEDAGWSEQVLWLEQLKVERRLRLKNEMESTEVEELEKSARKLTLQGEESDEEAEAAYGDWYRRMEASHSGE